LIQLAGTILFNVSTLHALANNLSATQQNQKIWRPDAFGSACFLVASAISWRLAGGTWLSWRPQRRGWWIALLNLTGSVAFGVSAIAAYVVPSSGAPRNAQAVNIGTFVGALCFLLGAYLLMPPAETATEAP
jgi:peptidoglycan/LPS O-acetylase OafA/YrhL